MTLPNNLRQYLINLDERAWRCIRGQIRWAYARETYKVPRRLLRFITALPADPHEWQQEAKEITALRRQRRREDRTKRLTIRAIQRRKRQAAYQRDYMRAYRERLRRGTV